MTAFGAQAERGDPRDRPARNDPVMTIGEVLARLRPEFPEVTISKLRFLEAEGLVEPLRAPSGYRKYTPQHVERLRFVLAAQRDRYLPLRIIREHLDARDRGERVVGLPPPVTPITAGPVSAPVAVSPMTAPTPVAPAPVAAPGPIAAAAPVATPLSATPVAVPYQLAQAPREMTAQAPREMTVAPREMAPALREMAPAPRAELGDVRLTRAQLAERSGLDEAAVADLERYGLLTPNVTGHYSGEGLTIARVAAALAEYGLEARHLRAYRATADREIGLLSQLVLPMARHGGVGGRDQAMEAVHELAALCAQLHGALVRQGLRQVLVP